MKEFSFPLSFSDIEKPECQALINYTVEPGDGYLDGSEREIFQRLKAFNDEQYRQWDTVSSHRYFDMLYWFTKAFAENSEFRSVRVLEQLCDSVYTMLSQLTDICFKLDSVSNVAELRVAFKMGMFLSFFFLNSTVVRKKAAQGDILADAMNKEANKRKKKAVQADAFKTIAERQKQMLDCINRSLTIDFPTLWQRKHLDDEFLKYYTNLGMRILESTLGKAEDIRAIIFNIFEVVLKNKPEIFKQLQFSLINLLYEEDVVDNLVHFFSHAQSVETQKLCTQTMIMTVACLNAKTNSNNAQSQAIKNTRDFLSKLSEAMPLNFYNNLQCFIKLYDSESYLLRNAITDIMANIIRQVLKGDSEDKIKNRDKFIMTLLQRIHDKNSHARAYVMNVLAQLVADNIVPKARLIMMLNAGVDRLKDVSVLTRKRAVLLIYNVLKVYQYIYGKDGKEGKFRTQEQLKMDVDTLVEEEATHRRNLDRLNEQAKHIEDDDTLTIHESDIKLVKKQIAECTHLLQFFRQYQQVLKIISEITETLGMLLGSKNLNDVVEVIKLFIFLKQLGIEKIEGSLRKIYMLVFSKEKGVKEEVLHCFAVLHIMGHDDSQVAENLIELFKGASLQDATCLEEILQNLIEESKKKEECSINREVYRYLWDAFIRSIRTNSKQDERAACISILRVAFIADQALLKQSYIASFSQILSIYARTGTSDYLIVKEIGKIMEKSPESIGAESKTFLMNMIKILVGDRSSSTEWYAACEQTLTSIYTLCEYPEQHTELLILELHKKLKADNAQNVIARFIFTLAHSSLKLLIHLDSLEAKLKKLKQQADKHDTNKNDEELDKVMGGIEGEFERRIQRLQSLADAIPEDPFIAKWLRIIEYIVKNTQRGSELERVAVLSFCKFMCISEKYCSQHMGTLFATLVKPNMDPIIKNNIIISMGDLLHRFPNLVQPHSRYLYQNLHDSNPNVRKTTMIVLTHLILNDMIKVKGEMCNIAILFEDSSVELQNLAHIFFNEINKKEPKFIYNMLPEMIAKLSSPDELLNGAHLTEKTFQCFAKNILGMLDKDKYSDVLIEKLCLRFSNTANMTDLRNTAYCLSQLNYYEKALRVLLSLFDHIRPKMEDPDISNSFRILLNKLKKTQKPEMKPLVEELENKIGNSNQQTFDVDGVRRKNQQQQQKKKKQPKRSKKEQDVGTDSRRRQRKQSQTSEDDMQVEQDVPSQRSQPRRERPVRNAPSRRRNPIIIESSDEHAGDDQDDYSQE